MSRNCTKYEKEKNQVSLFNGSKANRALSSLTVFAILLVSSPAFAQMYDSNWVYRSSADTTEVPCRNDSLSFMMFPPGAMSGMMSAFPDSIYCEFEEMPMDSLLIPHDSTVIGWYRVRIGQDSTNFDMMGYSMMGSMGMMQFYRGIECYLNWDSLMSDSLHGQWHPAGIMGWNGSKWVDLPGASIYGSAVSFSTSSVYSAVAFKGTPKTETAVDHTRTDVPRAFVLEQSYPNPFNPTATIGYRLAAGGHVSLKVYDILGNLVRTLVDQNQSAGNHSVVFNGTRLASGVYFYTLRSGSFSRTMRMVLMK